MNIKKYLRNILKDFVVPSYLMTNRDNKDSTYVVYNIMDEIDVAKSDNISEFKKYTVLFRLYSNGDYEDVYLKLDNLLQKNNFEHLSVSEIYDDELDMYQKSIYYTLLLKNNNQGD